MDEVEEALPQAFLEEFVARFDEDGLYEFVGPIVNSLAANMRSQSITKEYQIPMRVCFASLLTRLGCRIAKLMFHTGFDETYIVQTNGGSGTFLCLFH